MNLDLTNRPLKPYHVKALFDIFTHDELVSMGLRRDFHGRLIIDLSRKFHSGSLTLDKVWKFPEEGEEKEIDWQSVANEPSQEIELPQNFVLYLFSKAVEHPWFAGKLTEYYGAIPEVEL